MKLLVIVLLCVSFVWKLLSSWIEFKSFSNPIPENVKDVYDAETYEKWHSYHQKKSYLHIFVVLINFAVTLVLLLCNAFAAFASLFGKNPYLQMMAVVLLEMISTLVTIPIDYYDTMVIEEKYGFNKTTKKTFISDQIKNFILSFLIEFGIGSILTALHMALGDKMIVVFAIVLCLLVLALVFLSPIFSRIFNKFTPLEDGELKDKLTGLLTKNGYQVKAIEVMDASRRSSKLNAYFSGLGKVKRIVLYDTLVEKMTPDEICAVFSHELGHGLHKDTVKLQIANSLNMFIMAGCAYIACKFTGFHTAFGFDGINYGFALILTSSIFMSIVSPLFGLAVNTMSRKFEFAADAQAKKEGYGEAIKTSLKKLARENFSNLAPSKFTVIFEYNHPTLSERLDAIEK